jgi:putative nucleotidyltransferase with HDIG domain
MPMWWQRLWGQQEKEKSTRDGGSSRLALLKVSSDGGSSPYGSSLYWALGVGLGLLVLHLILFPPVPQVDLEFPGVGDISLEEIRAPFTFAAPFLLRDIEMRKLEQVVAVPPVLNKLDGESGPNSTARMDIWLEALASQMGDSLMTPEDRVDILSLQFPVVIKNDLRRLFRTADQDSLGTRMNRAWQQVISGGVVDALPPGKYNWVTVVTGQSETARGLKRITPQSQLEEKLIGELRRAGMVPSAAVESAAVMRYFIQPNLVYDDTETRLRQGLVRDAVPLAREFIKGERIIDQGIRVTDEQAGFLSELKRLVIAKGDLQKGSKRWVMLLNRALLLVLSLGLFGWLALIHYPQQLIRGRFVVALGITVALFLIGASIALDKPSLGPMAVPIAILALISTVLFRDKVGYTTTLLAMTLLSFLPAVEAVDVFSWFVMGMVTVVSVRRIRKRNQFYQTIVQLTVLSLLLIFLLQKDGSYVVGFFVPMLSVAFGLFLLPVIEPVVGVCSDLTLIELSDLNHPLLQRMALQAQGTYHHSQVVGQLAEHAARAVNANSLLTRVGALFHDIGKMQKPEYYVENQRADLNKHDELSPSMSALVISSHVKEGIELGQKWRLPQAVIDFIPEHHGTMVMEYFYHKALEDEGNETVKVDDFRYPGPKPRSKETAILMLADAAEAATRSLAKPTPSRIREITKHIVDKRMLSGELDESGLTLLDLAGIRESFIPLLTGIHHSRIVYPGQRENNSERIPERRGEKKGRS